MAAFGWKLVDDGRTPPAAEVPLAGGIIAGIGNLAIKFTSTFSVTVRVFRREACWTSRPRLGAPTRGER